MKKLSLLVAMVLILAISCHRTPTANIVKDTIPNDGIGWVVTFDSGKACKTDTIYLPDLQEYDSLRRVIISKDSALFEARLKRARVWYYDSLCLKNSRLDKYLKGWIRRTLEK